MVFELLGTERSRFSLKSLSLGILGTLFLALSSSVFAFVAGSSLSYMVEHADVIVYGEVVELEKLYLKNETYSLWATLKVEKALKGEVEEGHVKVNYCIGGCIADGAGFSFLERAILFAYILKDTGQLYCCLDGLNGKIVEKEGSVFPRFMAGEKRNQTLEEFFGKIKKLIRNQPN